MGVEYGHPGRVTGMSLSLLELHDDVGSPRML